jgi:pSer/pThr/pTyr-binding forkhead associated (FHA) protein
MRFEIHHETGRKEIVTWNKDKAVVGNGETADIQIEGEHISRNQIILEKIDGKIYVTDLDNPNGTYINDSLIEPHKKIEFLSFFPIQIGPKILIYLMPDEEEVEEQTFFKEKTSDKPTSLKITEDDFTSQSPERNRKDKKTPIPAPNSKKTKESKSQTKNIFITILVFGLAASAYFYNLKNEETALQEKNLTNNDPLLIKEKEKKETELKKFRRLLAQSKCVDELELLLCRLSKIQFSPGEGIKIVENTAYMILNFDRAQVTSLAEDVAEVPPPYRSHYLTLKVISSTDLWRELEVAGISKFKLINLLTVQNETKIVSTFEIDQNQLFSQMSLDDIQLILYSLKHKKNPELYPKINWDFVNFKSFE